MTRTGQFHPNYLSRALASECCRVAAATPGARNATLFRSSATLGELIPSGLSEQLIRTELERSAVTCGLDKDHGGMVAVRKTIESGIATGKQTPRSVSTNGNGKDHAWQPATASIRPSPHAAATPEQARAAPGQFPLWTTPVNGRPKFYGRGDEGPAKYHDEHRRHVYRHGGVPVRIKIKQKGGGFTNWYRVRNDHGTAGWQAYKPPEYVHVPYFGAIDPFDPELAGDVIYWPEGEKDVDTLSAKNFPAFTFGGTGDGLPDGCEEFVFGRHVVILTDNDDGGRAHAGSKAARCAHIAASVKIIHFPELPPKGDITDWLRAGHSLEDLEGRIETAPLWLPSTPEQTVHGAPAEKTGEPAPLPDGILNTAAQTADDAEIRRLAALPIGEYEKQRGDAAKRLGYRAGILDKLVEGAQREDKPDGRQGRPLSLPDPEPWPEPVSGAELLTDVAQLVRQHVVLSSAAADAVALWVVHTHAFDAAQIAPRLLIKSPEKRCGKTTLLLVIQNLVHKPLPTSNISTSALFRMIELARPTVLIDEADTFISSSEEIRGIINSGHFRASAYVTRTVGDNFEPRQFSTWASMATAGIGKLPGTIEDRGIAINLRRRRPDECAQRLRCDRVEHLKEAASRAFRWAKDHMVEITNLDPETLEGLHDRAADNWRPLLAIADCAGGAWPARARHAALELSTDGAADQDSVGTLLLNDIRAAFEARAVDRISGDELTAYLIGLDDRPWPEFNRGRPLTKAKLARQLAKFKIPSGTIRFPDGRTPRGYYLSSFDDAFARYLPPKSATTPQVNNDGSCGSFQSATSRNGVAFSKAPQPNNHGHCGSVAEFERGMAN